MARVELAAATPAALAAKVQSSGPVEAVNIRLNPSPFKVFTEEEAEHFAELCKTVAISEDIRLLVTRSSFPESGWSKVLKAMTSNRWIVGLGFGPFNGGSLPAEVPAIIAAHFAEAKHVRWLHFTDVPLTPEVLETIVLAAEDREQLTMLKLVDEHPVQATTATVEALARIKARYPDLEPFGGPPHGLLLNVLVAMSSIQNKQVEDFVVKRQAELLEKVAKQGAAACAEDTAQLVEAAKKEEGRLTMLMNDITEKYLLTGGAVALGLVPPSFDEYRTGQTQLRPAALESPQDQLTWQLAKAAYMRAVLEKLVAGVLQDLAPLRGQRSDEVYFLEALVGAVLKKHGLYDLSVTVPSFMVDCPWSDTKGKYTYVRHMWSCPAFERDDGGMFLYCQPASTPFESWCINDVCGSSARYFRLPDRTAMTPAAPGWTNGTGDPKDITITKGPPTSVFFRDVLRQSLEQKTKPEMRRLFTHGDELISISDGPPKDLARAQEKGPEWLLDANRCTFKVDCIPMLVLIFFFLENQIKALGGRITRLDNFHLLNNPDAQDFSKTGGIFNSKLTRPPCLHLNFVVDEWTFECMILLSDFGVIKEQIHKFYDITRATTTCGLLRPVFPPKAAASASSSTKASGSDASKLDHVLGAVLEAGRETKAQLEEAKKRQAKLEAMLEAQTQAAKEARDSAKEARDSAKEAREAQARMESQLQATQAKLEELLRAKLQDADGRSSSLAENQADRRRLKAALNFGRSQGTNEEASDASGEQPEQD